MGVKIRAFLPLLFMAMISAFDVVAPAKTEVPIPLPLGIVEDDRTTEERH